MMGSVSFGSVEPLQTQGIRFGSIRKKNSPKISANFEGPDTPEQFAAALYDYMAELEAAGMLQHPYSLDPRGGGCGNHGGAAGGPFCRHP